MDIRKVRSLVELMSENTDLAEIDVQSEDGRVKVKRIVAQQSVAVAAPALAIAPAVEVEVKSSEEIDLGEAVSSPIVGTYYEASSPGSAPFVKIGQKVNKGDVVCIIEAMKMMNSINAPCTGTVQAIEVVNGQPVEFGQPLLYIK